MFASHKNTSDSCHAIHFGDDQNEEKIEKVKFIRYHIRSCNRKINRLLNSHCLETMFYCVLINFKLSS